MELKEKEGKLFYELYFEFIELMAERMAANKGKYEPFNWLNNDVPVDDLLQATFRHLIEMMKGKFEDDGRKFGHLEAIACNAMMIVAQLVRQEEKEMAGSTTISPRREEIVETCSENSTQTEDSRAVKEPSKPEATIFGTSLNSDRELLQAFKYGVETVSKLKKQQLIEESEKPVKGKIYEIKKNNMVEETEGAKSIELQNLLVLHHYDFDREFLAIDSNGKYFYVMYCDEDEYCDSSIFNGGFVCIATEDKELMLDFFSDKITFSEFYNSKKAEFNIIKVHPLKNTIWNIGNAKKYDWSHMNNNYYWDWDLLDIIERDMINEWFEQS